MKKVMALMVSILFTAGVMAQTEQKTKTTQQTTTTTTAEKSVAKGHECYKMKEGALIHCMGNKTEVQKTNVTLKNGARITTTGEVVTSDGKTIAVANGQCVDMTGMVGDCEMMHANMKHDHKDTQGTTKDQY